jgi:hypothetical protein
MNSASELLADAALSKRLADFLSAASARPFQLGAFDCGILLADWCLEVRGVDPAAKVRGRYNSIDEAHALVGTRSLPALFNKLFRSVGVKRTRDPIYGDVAMIQIVGDTDLRGAIVTGGYVVIAAGGGLSRVRHHCARRAVAWSLQAGGGNAVAVPLRLGGCFAGCDGVDIGSG